MIPWIRLLCVLALLHAIPVSAGTVIGARDPAHFGQSLAALLEARDAAGLNARMNRDAVLARVLDGLDFEGEFKDEYSRGFLKSSGEWGESLVARIESGNARVRHVRSIARRDGSTQIVRVDHHDPEGAWSGADYLEFELGHDGRIVDWVSHASTTRMSSNVRRITAMMLGKPDVLESLFGNVSVDEDALATVNAYNAATDAGDFRKAHALLGEFPASFRKTRDWLGLRLSMSSSLDSETYRADLDEMGARFADDPEVQFALVDHFFYRSDFERMMAVIESFEQRVVSDGLTRQLACSGFIAMGKYPEARAACEESVRREPELEHAWWTLVSAINHMRDPKGLIGALETIESRFDRVLTPERLASTEGYQWLADDPVYSAWMASRHEDIEPR